MAHPQEHKDTRLLSAEGLLLALYIAYREKDLDEAMEVCGYVRNHFLRYGVNPDPGEGGRDGD